MQFLPLEGDCCGKPIDIDEANPYFKDLFDFKRNTEIMRVFETIRDPVLRRKVLRYFAGDEFAFVFTKDNLEEFLQTLNEGDNRGLVVFSGMRRSLPTLMGFIYERKDDNFELIQGKIQGKDGLEHPGIIPISRIPMSFPLGSIISNWQNYFSTDNSESEQISDK